LDPKVDITWKVMPDFQILDSVLTHHSSPQSTIQIDGKNLFPWDDQRSQSVRDIKTKRQLVACAKWLPSEEVDDVVGACATLWATK
jgi:hypothetical protein